MKKREVKRIKWSGERHCVDVRDRRGKGEKKDTKRGAGEKKECCSEG